MAYPHQQSLKQGSFLKHVSFPFRFLAIASLCFIFQGCIGIGILGIGDRSNPAKVPTLSHKKRLIPYQDAPLSSDYVISQWGEPNHREQIDGGGEIWEYRGNNLRWHGVIPMALLPIPLVVPFGHDYVTLVIQDGQVRSAVQTDWDFTFGGGEEKGSGVFFLTGSPRFRYKIAHASPSTPRCWRPRLSCPEPPSRTTPAV